MISTDDGSNNRRSGVLNIQGIIGHWKTYKLRFIPIPGNKNQCLQYCLNAFCHDIDEIKNSLFFCQFYIRVNIQYVVRIIMC